MRQREPDGNADGDHHEHDAVGPQRPARATAAPDGADHQHQRDDEKHSAGVHDQRSSHDRATENDGTTEVPNRELDGHPPARRALRSQGPLPREIDGEDPVWRVHAPGGHVR